MEILKLLNFTKKNNASDLHLSSGNPPILRVNGDVVPLRVPALNKEEVLDMIKSLMSESQRVEYEKNMELDFSVHLGDDGRFRVNAFMTISGPSAVLRTIPTKIQTIDELKLPKILKNIALKHKGLVLVTGPTGSGKSTTLAAMVDYINTQKSTHILTIEDPVEFIHKSKKSLINQREIGSSTSNFATALRAALREDIDVVLVGELRDLETISLALTAAETGHLVFATLHTSSAAKTIDRIIDVFPEGDKDMARTMLAGSLEAVISQLLVKTADNNNRIAIHDILILNSAVRNLIRDNKIPQIQSIMQVSSKFGMQTMKENIYKLLDEEKISIEIAKSVLNFDNNEDADKFDEEYDTGEFK